MEISGDEGLEQFGVQGLGFRDLHVDYVRFGVLIVRIIALWCLYW